MDIHVGHSWLCVVCLFMALDCRNLLQHSYFISRLAFSGINHILILVMKLNVLESDYITMYNHNNVYH